jgi:hypothetical protein
MKVLALYLYLQGMFWDNQVLSCMAEKCGMSPIDSCSSALLFLITSLQMHVEVDVFGVMNCMFLFQACVNPDCLYLHEVGSQDDSFTKDEIISAYTRYLYHLKF